MSISFSLSLQRLLSTEQTPPCHSLESLPPDPFNALTFSARFPLSSASPRQPPPSFLPSLLLRSMSPVTNINTKKPVEHSRDVEAQLQDERQPLLPPPPYSAPSSARPSTAVNPLRVVRPEREDTSRTRSFWSACSCLSDFSASLVCVAGRTTVTLGRKSLG